MYLIQLKFANKARAPQFMDGHNAWIQQGFDDGIFLVTGNLYPGLGGAILAHGLPREDLAARVAADPFVAEGIVQAEITEIEPKRTDPRLGFLTP